MYEVVPLAALNRCVRDVHIFANTIRHGPSPNFAKHVQHLSLPFKSTVDITALILSMCPEITDFFCWNPQSRGRHCATLLACLDHLQLTRFGAYVGCLFSPAIPDLRHPLFSHLTHLEMLDTHSTIRQTWMSSASWKYLPNLSHLAVGGSPCFDQESFILSEKLFWGCIALKVLVFHAVREIASPLDPSDPRLVCLNTSIDDLILDWENGARGGFDFWQKAEMIISERMVCISKSKPSLSAVPSALQLTVLLADTRWAFEVISYPVWR